MFFLVLNLSAEMKSVNSESEKKSVYETWSRKQSWRKKQIEECMVKALKYEGRSLQSHSGRVYAGKGFIVRTVKRWHWLWSTYWAWASVLALTNQVRMVLGVFHGVYTTVADKVSQVQVPENRENESSCQLKDPAFILDFYLCFQWPLKIYI